MRTLLQVLGGLGTGAGRGPHAAGGLGLLGGLRLRNDDLVDTQSETEVVAGPERGHCRGPQHRLASFGNGGCARLSFRNGAISLHTRSSVHEAHPALVI